MTSYDWQDIRERAERAFNGELPNPILENEIIAIFERHPEAVIKLIPDVAKDLNAGTIRKGWAILRARLSNTEPSRNVTVQGAGREDAEKRARSWIHNAGVHYDRSEEVTDALFGDFGVIRDHHTPELQAELLLLWHKRRPAGTAVETAELERADKWKTWHAAENERLHHTKAALAGTTYGSTHNEPGAAT